MSLAILAAAALAVSQPGAPARGAFTEGQVVRAVDGGVLGKVDRVVAGQDGRPEQVLVRTGPRLRTTLKALPASGLTRKGEDLLSGLTRAEADALPSVEQPPAR